jgi:hypothetical protein
MAVNDLSSAILGFVQKLQGSILLPVVHEDLLGSLSSNIEEIISSIQMSLKVGTYGLMQWLLE